MTIYKDILGIEVELESEVKWQDEGCEPEATCFCAVCENEITYNKEDFDKAMCMAIEEYIEKNDEELRTEFEEEFYNN